MLNRLIDHFKRRVINDNKGFIGSLISAGAGLFGAKKARDQAKKNYAERGFDTAPEYPEAEGSRKLLYERLQDFGGQPGYGAIAPDWADIWQSAKRKVNQYYWGSPTSPGVMSKVKASAARRGVSESPALQKSMLRAGVQEGQTISDMATEQATQKATFAEKGRRNWLNDLMQLSQQKPKTQYNQPNIPSYGPVIAQIGQQVGDEFSLDKLMKFLGMGGGGTPPSTIQGPYGPSRDAYRYGQ